jgi:preprotein translocase subunit SecG
MITVILVIHLLLAIALVGTVLLQRSEGGGLGIGGGGGGGGGMGGFMSGRATANLLTRATAVLAACFMATSLALAMMSGGPRESRSILDRPAATEEPQPAAPQAPSAPLTE